MLTLSGRGFADDSLVISLGGENYCEPKSVTSTQVICEVVLRNVYHIDNGGSDLSKLASIKLFQLCQD